MTATQFFIFLSWKEIHMKALLVLSLALISNVWAACPEELTGEYIQCSSTSRASIFNVFFVRLSVRNYEHGENSNPNFDVFILGNEDSFLSVSANGEIVETTEQDPDLGTYFVKTRATCTPTSLNIQSWASFEGLDSEEETIFSLKEPNVLEMKSYLNATLVNTTTCQKVR